MKVLISTCLLGVACKYSGGDNARPALVAALQAAGHELVPVCPEVYGGLPTPRTPAERIGSRVVTAAGADVTAQYRKGAEIALPMVSGEPLVMGGWRMVRRFASSGSITASVTADTTANTAH